MAKHGTNSQPVRAGALTLVIAVVIICLAVLATLDLTTAHADLALAQKQQALLAENAAAETAGQQWLAQVDASLAGKGSLPAGTTKAADGTLAATLPVAQGKSLLVAVQPRSAGGGRFRVLRWQLQTDWQADSSLTLWGGGK